MLARSMRSLCALASAIAVAGAAALLPRGAQAQQRDSAAVGVTARVPADSAMRDSAAPLVSPRRAALSSLFVPGLGQSALERGQAGALFVFVEALSITMMQKSIADLREAKRFENDSITLGYSLSRGSAEGVRCREGLAPSFRPIESRPRPNPPPETDTLYAVVCPTRWTTELVEARRTHVEDWVALLVFNHLISAADAFVAAHLWDLPDRVRVNPMRLALPRERRGAADGGALSVSFQVSW